MVARLPRSVWLLLAGEALASAGSGLTLPFLLIYLHRARGLDIAVATAAVAWIAAVGLVGNPLGGWLADRTGPRRTLTGGLVQVAVAALGLAFVSEPWHAFAATGLLGLGAAIVWPSQDALLATLATPEARTRAFSTRYATMNLSLGAGCALGAVIVGSASWTTLFVLQALAFLAYAAVTTRLPNPQAPTRPSAGRDAGWRALAGDRALRRLLPLVTLVFAAGYAQFNVAFPAFATGTGRLGSSALAAAFTANTLTIVVAQLPMCRWLQGRRRSHGLALVGVIWTVAWLTALGAGHAGGGRGAMLGFVLAMVLFGLGETALAPTLGPLVNELASDELRGRYNGASALASTCGYVIGPLIAGAALDGGATTSLLVALAAACLLAGCGALTLERRLTPRTPRSPLAALPAS